MKLASGASLLASGLMAAARWRDYGFRGLSSRCRLEPEERMKRFNEALQALGWRDLVIWVRGLFASSSFDAGIFTTTITSSESLDQVLLRAIVTDN